MRWFDISKSKGRSSSCWSSSQAGTLGNFWNVELYMVRADTQKASKEKCYPAAGSSSGETESGQAMGSAAGRITFCTMNSASKNLTAVLHIFSPSNCLYPTSSPGEVPWLLFPLTHFKSTSKAFEEPPEIMKTVKDPEIWTAGKTKLLLLQPTSIMVWCFSGIAVWS